MPVANDHVLWNQIHRRVSVIAARLPFSQTRKFAIEQTITPQPQLPFGRLQMIVNRADFVGEKLRLVAPLAARTLVFTNVEHFIHPGMKRIRLEGFAHLVHQREHHLMNLRVTRAIALAENEHVHRARSQLLLDKLDELIHAIDGRRRDAKAAHWQRSIRGSFCGRQIQCAEEQQADPVLREVRREPEAGDRGDERDDREHDDAGREPGAIPERHREQDK